ncbi:YgiQ family radical SAM protein, partial [Cutibacterium acnes]
IARILESEGFRVGIVAQPNWKSTDDLLVMGKPKLGVLISSGVIDSMVNHYTVSKKQRTDDAYSPGGKAGFCPDRAVIVYSNLAKQAFKDVPVIIGGLDASLRRFAHYDYWDNKVRRSILADSKADLLIYGMGEKPIIQLAKLLDKGANIEKIKDIRGTCYLKSVEELPEEVKNSVLLNKNVGRVSIVSSYEEVSTDKAKYAEAFKA